MIRRALLGAALSTIVIVGPVSAAQSTVIADDNFFSPSIKTVSQGDKVNWLNSTTPSDDNDHTSTANLFNMWNKNLPNGSAASTYFTFGRAGSFAYHCEVHPSTMKGSVSVKLKATRIDSNSWTIRMATTNAPAGFVHEVQRRKKGTNTWFTLATTANATARFDAPSAGTWQLRGRFKQTGGSATGYSPTLEVATQ
jgi:plastocyanin